MGVPEGVISIHASRGGSDLLTYGVDGDFPGFQSTLPAGEATCQRKRRRHYRNHFNPRFPRGKRHTLAADTIRAMRFQSTLPAGEATILSAIKIKFSGYFNPRFPRGKRPKTLKKLTRDIISIHASRGGSDKMLPAGFNAAVRISIHASRGGSD